MKRVRGMSWASAVMESRTPNSGCAKQTQMGGMISFWTSQGSLHGPPTMGETFSKAFASILCCLLIKKQSEAGGDGRKGCGVAPRAGGDINGVSVCKENPLGSVPPGAGAQLGAWRVGRWRWGLQARGATEGSGGAPLRGGVGSTAWCMGTKLPGTGSLGCHSPIPSAQGGKSQHGAKSSSSPPGPGWQPVLSIPPHGSRG